MNTSTRSNARTVVTSVIIILGLIIVLFWNLRCFFYHLVPTTPNAVSTPRLLQSVAGGRIKKLELK